MNSAAPAPSDSFDAVAANANAAPAPWFGRRWEHRHAAVAGLGSLALCLVYVAATRQFAPEVSPGWLEFSGTMTSLWCVWITQRRNVLALPIGIVSVILMGEFFRGIGLVGQQWLHWAYYIPIQVWAWRQWTRGGAGGGELDVTYLRNTERAWVLLLVGLSTLLVGAVIDNGWQSALHIYWDASIVGSSIVAMVLLSHKKVESYWLWFGPVNISAIALYATTGATMFAALYVVFLCMAVVGMFRWRSRALHSAAAQGGA